MVSFFCCGPLTQRPRYLYVPRGVFSGGKKNGSLSALLCSVCCNEVSVRRPRYLPVRPDLRKSLLGPGFRLYADTSG